MKKIQALLGGVFFLGILCFLIPSKPIEIEETFSEQYNGESKQYYEVYLEESGVTTSNLENFFAKANILKVYPLFSSIYEEQIKEKYYSFNPMISLSENSRKMEEYYFALLEEQGLIHDKQIFSIHGIPISKIVLELNEQEKNQLQKKYSIQKEAV